MLKTNTVLVTPLNLFKPNALILQPFFKQVVSSFLMSNTKIRQDQML